MESNSELQTILDFSVELVTVIMVILCVGCSPKLQNMKQLHDSKMLADDK